MTLQELLEELEKDEGPSRELDAELWLMLNPNDASVKKWAEQLSSMDADGRAHWVSRFGADNGGYTASLDAITALIEEKLPHHSWLVYRTYSDFGPKGGDIDIRLDGTYTAEFEPVGPARFAVQAEAVHPALALCIALVKALIAQEAGDDE